MILKVQNIDILKLKPSYNAALSLIFYHLLTEHISQPYWMAKRIAIPISTISNRLTSYNLASDKAIKGPYINAREQCQRKQFAKKVHEKHLFSRTWSTRDVDE